MTDAFHDQMAKFMCLEDLEDKSIDTGFISHFQSELIFALMCLMYMSRTIPIGTASANSVESNLGCTSRIYFDNVKRDADVKETMPTQ